MELIEKINLGIAIFLIASGFLVKLFPNLIAGYNDLTETEKKKVDSKGLTSFMRNCLVIMGVLFIAGSYLIIWLGFPSFSLAAIIPVFGIGMPLMIIGIQKFDNTKE